MRVQYFYLCSSHLALANFVIMTNLVYFPVALICWIAFICWLDIFYILWGAYASPLHIFLLGWLSFYFSYWFIGAVFYSAYQSFTSWQSSACPVNSYSSYFCHNRGKFLSLVPLTLTVFFFTVTALCASFKKFFFNLKSWRYFFTQNVLEIR